MGARACMSACAAVCVCVCIRHDAAQVRECVPPCACLHMCLWVFAVVRQPAAARPPNGPSLKTSLLLWHFSPQHASLAMCDISPGVGVMANSGPDSPETGPWWRQSNNTVTSHSATMLQY